MTSRPGPITANERLFTLDAIRGVALLGIFVMNMPGFSRSFFAGADGTRHWHAWWDRSAAVLRNVLLSGKFNSMFSMLFAVGFVLMLERLERTDVRHARALYLRRIAGLLAFGVLHTCLFWNGDVLHIYAVLGLMLLGLRRLPEGLLWASFGAVLLYPTGVELFRLVSMTPEDVRREIATAQLWEASNNAAYGAGSFLDAAREHTREFWFNYTNAGQLRDWSVFYAQLAATLLLGLILGRRRFFQNAAAHVGTLKRLQLWLLVVGVVAGAVFSLWRATVKQPATPTWLGVIASVAYSLSRVSIMGFYVATITRACLSETWRRRLAPIAAAGRMPLTNYLMQTLIATFVFYGWGLGLWGKVGPALDLLIAPSIFFMIQVPLSRRWLQHFELGPMERLWRWLTYGRTRRSRELREGEASA